MKKYLIPFITLCVFACSKPQNKETKAQISQEKELVTTDIKPTKIEKKIPKNNNITEKFKFKELNTQAVLIGDKIELLNNDLKKIDDISNWTQKIVDVVGVSDSLFNQKNDICEAFWYVKIKFKNKEGIVNGKQVYKIQSSEQGIDFTIKNKKVEILTTEHFAVALEYQNDFMGCPMYRPVVIKDSANNFFGIIDFIPNKYSKKGRVNNKYPLFQLQSNEGMYDNIYSAIIEGTNIRLKIRTLFQTEQSHSEVVLKFDKNKYIAEYIHYGEIIDIEEQYRYSPD